MRLPIALLALFGTPATLVRIGLIGSAAFETGAAKIAAESAGAPLGGPGYDQHVFALAFITMSLAGAGWMVEGSPARLMRDYNQLVDGYNRGARI